MVGSISLSRKIIIFGAVIPISFLFYKGVKHFIKRIRKKSGPNPTV